MLSGQFKWSTLFIIYHRIPDQGCLGALGGTHVEVRVVDSDKPRYRNQKGQVSINVLGYSIWKGVRYHLKEWERGPNRPQSPHELFNLRHSSARNMLDDPLELEVPDVVNNRVDPKVEFVSTIDVTPAWTAWHDELSMDMYHEWLHRR
ncbi:UNVERIFIED_CONTAM: hypothetical protein Sradi_1770000 [Sesamum radiatum]|uniref:Uncharacterized protein n=1 Tax=Sesamum radiatum TaxID=300843 RepID=A0AAW2TY84_SESRA